MSETLDNLLKDLESSFIEFLRANGEGYTDASAAVAAKHFIARFDKYAHDFAYREARRLVGKL